MTRDQWALFNALCGGWVACRLLTDFEYARKSAVAGQHGRSGIRLHDGSEVRGDTTAKSLTGLQAFGEKPIVTLTWTEIHAWVKDLPADVIAQSKAMRTEWGVICRDAHRYDVGYMPLGPGWAEKTIYGPKTQRAQNAIECDIRERALRTAERELIASLAPSDEPMDLLEMLGAMA